MSLDLPHSSSLHERRRPAPPPVRRRRRDLGRLIAAALAFAALGFGAARLYALLSRPRIDRIDPAIGEPGQVVRIEGRRFGSERGEGRVEVDGVSPTASSYLTWADDAVLLRLPAAVDSGLVHLVTRHGRSNAKLFMNRARLPLRAEGERGGRSGPFISSITPDAGPIGSLLVISGLDFGANRGDASVSFSWAAERYASPQRGQAIPSMVANSEPDLGYESWSDKEIRVRIPDGAASGAVTVVRGAAMSNSAFFRVSDAPGVKRYSDRLTYSLSQSITVSDIKASGANELFLWKPNPAQTAAQRVLVLGREPEPLVPDYRGTAIFRFKDLVSGSGIAIKETQLVEVFAVESEVRADAMQAKPRDPPALMARYLEADERVPSAEPEIKALAAKIAAGERNPWKAARFVWNWLGKNLAWTGTHVHERPVDALKDMTADSYSYALLSCALLRAVGLPSLPMAGYLVARDRSAIRHYWVESYVYGLGWLPLDPVLGSGAILGVESPWEDRQRYFGSLDNRHIAFSRGFIALAPMSPNGRRASKDRRWSLQSFYEEAVGGLESYSSFWSDVEVTGMY